MRSNFDPVDDLLMRSKKYPVDIFKEGNRGSRRGMQDPRIIRITYLTSKLKKEPQQIPRFRDRLCCGMQDHKLKVEPK